MSSGTLRQRGGQSAKKAISVPPATRDELLDSLPKHTSGITAEWDYKLALAVITAMAFVTRFWGIGHPNEVVFDEVHFGKVRKPKLGWNGSAHSSDGRDKPPKMSMIANISLQ